VHPIRIRPRANSDLIEIWSYIAEDCVANADAFIDRLYEKIQGLAKHSRAGRRREQLGPGIPSFPFGRHVIFEGVRRSPIEIVRVLHGARGI
jgi:toxin ParE1/3/4